MVNAKPSFKVQKFNEVRVCVNGQYSKALKILKKKNGTEFSMLYARLHMYLSYIRTKFYKIPCRGFIGVTRTEDLADRLVNQHYTCTFQLVAWGINI